MATLKDDLRQRDLEAFERFTNESDIANMLGAQRIRGVTVRAAAKAGWFTDVTEGDIDDMTGKQVRQLFEAINERYEALTTLDPL